MADRRLEENIGEIIEESAETVRQPSVLFNYLDFQKIKIYLLHKAVLPETGFAVPLKITDICVQPDRFSQIKLITYILKRAEYLMRSGVIRIVTDDSILKQTVISENFGP